MHSHSYTHIYIHTYMYMYTYLHINISMYAFTHACAHTHVRAHTHARTRESVVYKIRATLDTSVAYHMCVNVCVCSWYIYSPLHLKVSFLQSQHVNRSSRFLVLFGHDYLQRDVYDWHWRLKLEIELEWQCKFNK